MSEPFDDVAHWENYFRQRFLTIRPGESTSLDACDVSEVLPGLSREATMLRLYELTPGPKGAWVVAFALDRQQYDVRHHPAHLHPMQA